MGVYKRDYSLQKRKDESERMLKKYPDRVPIIVERDAGAKSISDLDKKKYLTPRDITIGQFIYVIRKRLKLSSEKALFVFIGSNIPDTARPIDQIYDQFKDEDGFLYLTYTEENTFG